MTAWCRSWVCVCAVFLGTPCSGYSETTGAAPTDAPQNIAAHPTVRKFLADLMKKSPTIRRQCADISSAGNVEVSIRLTARPKGYSRASTDLVRSKTGQIHAYVEIPVGTDLVELLAHELEHIVEQIEGVSLPSLVAAGSPDTYRVEEGFESARARKAGTAAAREVDPERR